MVTSYHTVIARVQINHILSLYSYISPTYQRKSLDTVSGQLLYVSFISMNFFIWRNNALYTYTLKISNYSFPLSWVQTALDILHFYPFLFQLVKSQPPKQNLLLPHKKNIPSRSVIFDSTQSSFVYHNFFLPLGIQH